MKKLIFSLLIIFVAFTLVSCESPQERKKRQKNEKTALKYSCKYIEEKYNFEPEIIKYESDYQQKILSREYFPRLLVEMSYNNHKFLTYINYDGTNAYDSYQHEDIKAALSNTINEQISGLKDLDLFASNDIRSNTYHDFNNCLCSTYFDGTNLDSVLSECQAYYTAYYVNKQFPDLDIVQVFGDSIIGSFVSYRSEAAMKRLPNVQPEDHFSDVKVAPYVECMQKTDGYHTHFNLNHFDTIDYISFDVSSYDPKIHMTLDRLDTPYELKSISKVSPLRKDNDTSVQFNDLTDTYMIETDVDIHLFVYFPIDESLYSEGKLRFRCMINDIETGETKLLDKPIDIRGDYAVGRFALKKNSTLTFCLANIKETLHTEQ